jgi:chromosome segregation ATPase
MKSSNGQDIETQLSFAVKEVERLKDENSKLGKYIEERERELLHQVEKYKAKLNALKKDLRAKEKDYDDLKASHVKFEREKKDQASEREELKVQVTKITEEYQTVLVRKENDFYVEKRNMKATIDEQGKAIGELMATR